MLKHFILILAVIFFVTPTLALDIVPEDNTYYLDLQNEVIQIGAEKNINLYQYNLEKDQIWTFSVSPDGRKVAFIIKSGQDLRVQVWWSKGLTATDNFFKVGARKDFKHFQPINWSANSNSVVTSFQKQTGSGETYIPRDPFKEMTTIRTPEYRQTPMLSPNGRLLAYGVGTQEDSNKPLSDYSLFYTDTIERKDYEIGKLGKEILAWPKPEMLLICRPWANGKLQPHLITYDIQTKIEKSEMVMPIIWNNLRHLSPDGKTVFLNGRGVIISPADHEDWKTFAGGSLSFYAISWEPKGKFLLVLEKNDKANPDLPNQTPNPNRLWLIAVENETKLLVASGIDIDEISKEPMAEISSDRRHVFYASGGQFKCRPLLSLTGIEADKIRQSSQEELKEKAKIAAYAISNVLEAYFMNNMSWPKAGENVVELLVSTIEDKTVFYNPDNPNQLAFHYQPSTKEPQRTEDLRTICLGYLDWGKGWKIYIYADNHHEIIDDNTEPKS